jgi:biopolymer transport protein TolQ
MDPAAAVTPESLNFFVLFMKADWVVKLVMLGLAGASLWSWTVILDKSFRLASLNREANSFEDSVASGKSLEEVAAQAGERPRHALPRMLQGALKEWRDARNRGLATDTQAAFLIQRIDRVLDACIARESARIEDGLGSLAIVATASPFIGLFGTVWGIIDAFQGLGTAGAATLRAVAPGISEALITTAAGLAAAIPAVIAYNAFSHQIKEFATRSDDFALELLNAFERPSAPPQPQPPAQAAYRNVVAEVRD